MDLLASRERDTVGVSRGHPVMSKVVQDDFDHLGSSSQAMIANVRVGVGFDVRIRGKRSMIALMKGIRI